MIAHHRRWRLVRRALLAALLVALVIGFYVLVVTAGTMREWVVYNSYHDMLAEAFRHHQLSLLQLPPPELTAQANPYHPANVGLWMWDATLYAGKYYLYWGPFPAIVQATVKAALGISALIGDQYLVFGFVSLAAAASALVCTRMASRLFPRCPTYLVALGCLALALVYPMPYLLARAGVYEAAIAGGQACLVTGLVPAFNAVWRRQPGRLPSGSLCAAGCAWGLALACRVTLLPAIALLILAVAVATAGVGRGSWRRLSGAIACAGVPVAVVVALLLAYNKARFHHWFEFGVAYQLTTLVFKLSASFIPDNLYTYALRSPEWSCAFPFANAHWVPPGAVLLPTWMKLAPGYQFSEPVVGLLIAAPVAWLGVIALGYTAGLLRGLRAAPAGPVSRWTRSYLWCAVSFTIMGTVSGATALTVFAATMRYLCDVAFGLVLLGLLGALTLWSRARRSRVWSGAASALVATAMLVTIAFGVCIGHQGYYNHVAAHVPAQYQKLTAIEVCH